MNTPTHMLAGAALFGKPQSLSRTTAAIIGGLLPDVPAILLVAYALRIKGDTPQYVFSTLYFSPEWQAIMAPSHAFPIWGAALALALWFRNEVATAFLASGLFHVACDFLLHHDDAHRSLWPFSDWRFASPVSYWDPAHYGNIFAPFEMALAVALIGYLFYRHRSLGARLALGAVGLIYGAQMVAFAMMFRS